MLRADGTACRIRTWSYDPSIAQLVVFNQSRQPTAGTVEQWLAELVGLGYSGVRTGALNPHQATVVEGLGFRCIQELVLLEHLDPRAYATSAAAVDSLRPTRRLTDDELEPAGDVDALAFGHPWGMDATGIADVCRATSRHRARWIGSGPIEGYAISGRDAKIGFLQRLAVHPQQQRRGVGLALVTDALRWHARWRVARVLVNTHIDNGAALHLYERVGFTRHRDRLRVFEKSLS